MKFELKSKFNNFIYLLLTLLFVCTAVNVGLNFADSGDSDLSNIAVAADQPTNTNYYWTDTEAQTEQDVDFTSYTLSGSGSKTVPYLIQSETDLAFLSWTIYNDQVYGGSDNKYTSGSDNHFYSDVYFKQTKNLDLSAYYWQPIGIYYTRTGTTARRYFSGNYDGGGYTVSGVFTPAGSSSAYSYQGLFGYVRGRSSTQQASIANVGVIDSFVQGYQYVGGVVGYEYSNSTVSNVYNTGSVSGSGYSVGGVVGYEYSNSTVSNVYNTGVVSGTRNSVGGVVGYATATVSNVYNTGVVSGTGDRVGGVVGDASSPGATVSNAYNTGSVSGDSQVGGVVGYADATVSNVYNTGSVSGNSVGGVVGDAYYATITNAYNTGIVSGSSSNVGGVVGWARSSTISNAYNTGSVSGTGNYVGGVVGYAHSSSTVTNTYYGGACTLDVGIGSGSGSAATKIDSPVEEWAKNEEWYRVDATGEDGALVWKATNPWDFDFIWYMDLAQNDGYPVLYTDQNRPVRYWIDEYVQTEKGVDFTNYTLSSSITETDTYLIQSETDLAFLSWTIYNDQVYGGSDNKYTSGSNNYFYSDVCFKQTKNLDLSAYHWQPIGIGYTRDGTSASRYFSGNYDGGGYTVSGVFTPAGSSNAHSYQGLFGYVAGRSSTQQASIANIGVIDSFVQGYSSVGGVVGYAYYATISNAYNTGIVSGTGDGVGGVVGSATATVSNAYNTGSVSGSSNVGGVVGYAYGPISNVYNIGSVSGSFYVGGVVGYAYSSSTVSNTYYGGACTLDVGIGSGSGSATKIDSLVEEWAKNEEWYSAEATLEDGTLIWDSAYPWDFDFTWYIDSTQNEGYPVLYTDQNRPVRYWTDTEAQTEQGVDFTNYTLSRSGTETDTYLIQSETDLAFLSWTIYNDQVYGGEENKYTSGSDNYFYSDVCFKQTKNLDLSAYHWQPIGIGYTRDGTSADRYFSGNYDGGGYTVSGVFTPAGSGDAYSYQGLFGYVRGRSSTQQASIANVGVIDSFVQGYDYVGGVVGYAYSNATVSNVYNTGVVSGTGDGVGGVVGYATATVSNAYNTGVVSGTRNSVGGVVGDASGTVSNVYNTGIVSGTGNYVGGVVGYAGYYATVSNVYNTGSVSGRLYVGGLVGHARSSTISNAYNTGIVSGTGNYVGGVVGYAPNSTISNAYNTGSVSGTRNYVGGVVGYALGSATISDCGVECAVITGTSNVGIFVGQNASSSATIENCYAIVDGDLSPYGSNSGTVTNCLWIAGGVKYYLGTDFSGFAWLNTDSCPIPKGLSWMGQFWTGDITAEIMASSEWTEWVA